MKRSLKRIQQRYGRIIPVWILCLFVILSAACGTRESNDTETSEAADTVSSESAEKGADGPGIKIGFIVKENGRDHWIRMKEAAEKCCEENGVELLFLAGSSDAVAGEQISKIDQLIDEKADAICISPVSDEMVYTALTRAADAGIPVFAVDTDTVFSERAAYIGTDNYAAAKEGAMYAAGKIGKGGTAVILRGTLGDSVHDERAEGIADGLGESGVTVCRSLCTSAEDAGEAVRKLLQDLPDLDLLITTEDEITLAAWKRVSALGNTSVGLYGFDGTGEVASLILKNRQVLGTTAQFPEETGRKTIETVLGYLESGSTESAVNIPYKIITPENAADYCASLPEEQADSENTD